MEVPGSQAAWSAVKWRAVKAELFPRFRSLTDDVSVLSAEMRAFLDTRRRDEAGLSVLDFGGGSGELVGAAVRPQDHHVIIESGDDRSTVLASQSEPFDALIFSHVLPFIADPIGLFAELAVYSRPRAGWLAIVVDDTGTQADISREAEDRRALPQPFWPCPTTRAPARRGWDRVLLSHGVTRAVARSQTICWPWSRSMSMESSTS